MKDKGFAYIKISGDAAAGFYDAIVDRDDYDLLNRHKWHLYKGRPAKSVDKSGRRLFMDSLVYGSTDGRGYLVHLNKNKLDCRKQNIILSHAPNGIKFKNKQVRLLYKRLQRVDALSVRYKQDYAAFCADMEPHYEYAAANNASVRVRRVDSREPIDRGNTKIFFTYKDDRLQNIVYQ